MTRRAAGLLLLLALSACQRSSAPPQLKTDEKIAQAALNVLVGDGKPVCVERETLGSPLSIWRVATQGRLQQSYDLAWFPPKPFRPPHMPTLQDLRRASAAGQEAHLPEPPARTDQLPQEVQADLQREAAALAPPSVPAHRVTISSRWAPKGVVPRLWPAGGKSRGCDAQYILSGIKWNERVAFVAVRVDHWGTVFAFKPDGDGWKPLAQWGSWLY
jgi:hypothetical protein